MRKGFLSASGAVFPNRADNVSSRWNLRFFRDVVVVAVRDTASPQPMTYNLHVDLHTHIRRAEEPEVLRIVDLHADAAVG